METTPHPSHRSPRFWLINVGAWSAMALLFAVQGASRQGFALPSLRAVAGSLVSFLPCILLTPPVWGLATRYRFGPDERARSIAAHAAGLTTYIVVAGGLMGAFVWLLPWTNPAGSIWEYAVNAMGRFIAYDTLAYLLVVAAALAFAYSTDARERSVTAARLQGQLAEARLQVLSGQLQPHFLFNTLNAISALVHDEPQKAERLLARLSELLRQSLRDGAQPQVSLGSELAFLEKYVEVQEVRFGDRLNVTFEVDSDVLDARVPNLILQPLVENAIQHGIAPRAGPGSVHIAARRAGDRVTLSVADNGLGVRPGRIEEGIGLKNTRARLRELYGDNHDFVLVSAPTGGTICSMQLPFAPMTAVPR